jgi:hypothetical protein
MTEFKASTVNKIVTMLRQMERAQTQNPYSRPAMTTPPTVAMNAVTDAALGASVALATSAGLTAAGQSRVAYYGGIPKAGGSLNSVQMPVTTVLPATVGNVAANAATGASIDQNAWCYAEEIMTDAPTAEFQLFINNAMRVMLQVDDEYVDKTGYVGAQAGGAANFLEVTFGGARKVRRIRLMHALRAGSASGSGLVAVRVTPGCSFWKPRQPQIRDLHAFGDSYTEGQVTSFMLPTGPMIQVAGELLGFKSTLARAVGGTGYVSAGTGRSRCADVVPLVLDPASALYSGRDADLIMSLHGYNDRPSPAADITAGALLSFQRMRSYSAAPIVVLGAQSGNKGPDALALTVENAIIAAVTQFNDPYCKFAPVSTDPSPWLFGTGFVGGVNGSGNTDFYVGGDQVHPSDDGHVFLGYRIAQAAYDAVRSMVA